MALALPQSLFRTYIDIDTREFKTHHYVRAPLHSFSPPETWKLSPSNFRGMICLDISRFYDTESADRPRSYVIIPSERATDDQHLQGLSMFEYATNELYVCHPARSTIPAQIRARDVSGSDVCVVSMPSPNCSAQIPLTTLFHEVVVEMRFQGHLNTQDHRDINSWFDFLPQAVQLYLAPLQNRWLTEWLPALDGYKPGYGTCELCDFKDHNLRRHHLRHHAPMRAIYFCPIVGCPSVLIDQQGLRDHLRQNTHQGGDATMGQINAFGAQNCFWPMPRAWAGAILESSQKFHAYIMLHAYAGVALQRRFFAAKNSIIYTSLMGVLNFIRPRFTDPSYSFKIIDVEMEDCEAADHDVPVLTVVKPVRLSVFAEPAHERGRAGGFLQIFEQNQKESEREAERRDTSMIRYQPMSGYFEDAVSVDPAPAIPVTSVPPEDWISLAEEERTDYVIPNLELVVTTDVVEVALAGRIESPEGEVGPSVAISLPEGVDSSSWSDTACPVPPEVSDGFTPEAPEGSPSSGDILAVPPGASASPFPGEQGIEVLGFSGSTPTVINLMRYVDGLEDVAAHQQRLLDRGSVDRWMMRRSLVILAQLAGVDLEKPDLGCQRTGKH